MRFACRSSVSLLVLAGSLGVLAAPRVALAACGDGVIDGSDVCDDGNTLAGDGCGATCTVETGFSCRTQTPIPIVNDSFEVNPTGPGGGWTVGRGDFDWVDGLAGGMCLGPSGEGTRHVDMNGFTQGQLYQDITTVVGDRVVVTFLGSANCFLGTGEPCDLMCTKRLTVSVSDAADATGTAYATSVYDLRGHPRFSGWPLQRFEFEARSTRTRLTLTGSDPSAAGPMPDRIRIAASVCDETACGDGVRAGGEECDDRNSVSGDGCSAACAVELGWTCATPGAACTGTCGDGFVVSREQCDDGGTTAGDGCSATCTVEPGFACALDPFTNRSVCEMTCGSGSGSGRLDPGEACDDGNTINGDGCSATCTIEMGFACAVQTPIPITNGSFELEPLANGWTLATGTIDWVDSTSPAGCWPAGLGRYSIDSNGAGSRGRIYQDIATTPGQRVTVGFLGNANCTERAGDVCSNRCTKRLTVSVHDVGTDAPFASAIYDFEGSPQVAPWRYATFSFIARAATTRLSFTGSDPSFAGPMIDRVAVSASVCLSTRCGDAMLAMGEQCDDGNTTAGDGCGSDCLVEIGWMCPPPPMPCTSRCGDGIVVPSEGCDDGNTAAGDGCSPTCTVEPGFVCLVDPFTNASDCVTECGDGGMDVGEECDDGNRVDTDTCSNRCRRGPGEPCTLGAQCELGLCPAMFCAGCYDTAAPGGVDFGCMAPLPVCDTAGIAPICVECIVAADCDAGETCIMRMCVPAGTDAGPLPDAAVTLDAAMTVDAGTVDAATTADASMTADASTITDASMTADAGPALDAGPRVGGASGGACICGVARAPSRGGWLVTLGALALVAARRRRRPS